MTDEAAAGEAPADTTVEANEADTTETRAREQGWRPKDEWTGKPENWKPAEVYLEHGDLKSKVAKQDEVIARLKRTTEAAIERQKKAYEAEIASLKEAKKRAVKAGDADTVEKIDDKIDELKAEAKSEPAKTDDEDKDEVLADWAADNAWYQADAAMTNYALAISQGYAVKNPEASMKDNLAYVDKKLREKFPNHNWGRAAPKTASANGHALVDGGGFGGSRSAPRGKTAADLPADAKDIGNMLVKDGLYKNLGEYAKDYFAEEKANA